VRKRVKVCVRERECDSTHAAIDKRAVAVATGIISALACARALRRQYTASIAAFINGKQLSSAGINHINGFLGTDCASSQ